MLASFHNLDLHWHLSAENLPVGPDFEHGPQKVEYTKATNASTYKMEHKPTMCPLLQTVLGIELVTMGCDNMTYLAQIAASNLKPNDPVRQSLLNQVLCRFVAHF